MLRDDTACRLTMVQLACETDFVAKTENFQNGLRGILNTLHQNKDLLITNQEGSDADNVAKILAANNMS